MRTYGTLTHEPGYAKVRPSWALEVEPHVAMKVKRTFARAQQGRTSRITLADTVEVARDLEWFFTRYPVDMSPEVAALLTSRANRHREQETAALQILDGFSLPDNPNWLEPARPHRHYQQQAIDLASISQGLLLGDPLGLGKTQSATGLLRDPAARPALIVCPTHLPRQWEREIKTVFPSLTTHIAKSRTPYEYNTDVLILNYAKLAGWRDHLAGVVQTVIFDEVHELRREGSEKYNAAAHLAGDARHRMGLSATPIWNYGGEVWNIFNVLAPDVLGGREEFIREWSAKQWNGNVTISDPAALSRYLTDQGVFLRRKRSDVAHELSEVDDPRKVEVPIPSDPKVLDAVAADITAMASLIVDESADHRSRFHARGEFDMKIRQATGIAKAPFVADFARMLLEDDDEGKEKVVIFGWHHACYGIWRQRLAEYNPVMYTGQESPKQKNEAFDQFVEGDARVMLMSLRSGAGLDGLQNVCNMAIFGELDWAPAVHEQALGRFARPGQTKDVVGFYLVTDDGSDPVIAGVHELKKQQADPFINPEGALFTLSPEQTGDRVRDMAHRVLQRGRTAKTA